MRIVFFGSGDFGVPSLRSLVDHGHEIPLVVTQPDRGSGRGRKLKPTPIKDWAEQLNLPVLATPDVNQPDVIEQLHELKADLGLVIAFGQKINAPVRELFPQECVNLHASLLPKYRGAAPFQWTIINGDEKAGVTIFRLVDRMDAGPVYVSRYTYVKPEERAGELHDRLAAVGVDAVLATLDILENQPDFQPAEQDEAQATKAPKLRKEDGYLDFTQPAEQLANLINGLWPWPGAVCTFLSKDGERREKVTLAMARLVDEDPAKESPGELDFRLYAATGAGYLEILEIKPEGGRLMRFQDFVNGRHVQPGDRLAIFTPADGE